MSAPTNWRDLADQLTPGQVQHLTRREELLRRGSRHRKDDADIDADLLGDARDHIEGNERDQRFAHMTVQIAAAAEALILGTGRRRNGRWIGWTNTTLQDSAKSTRGEQEARRHIPEPAGAVYCWHWESPELTGAAGWRREVEGRAWRFDSVSINIGGWQVEDGTVTYWCDVEANTQLTPAQAGDVAAAMSEAAAELARLSQQYPPFM